MNTLQELKTPHAWLFVVGLLLILATKVRIFGIQLVPPIVPVEAVSGIFCVAGLLVSLWAHLILMIVWSPTGMLDEGPALIAVGPYAYVRYPNHTALLLLVGGSAIFVGSLGAMIGTTLCITSLWISTLRKDVVMLTYFADSYTDYMARVRRLVPFVI